MVDSSRLGRSAAPGSVRAAAWMLCGLGVLAVLLACADAPWGLRVAAGMTAALVLGLVLSPSRWSSGAPPARHWSVVENIAAGSGLLAAVRAWVSSDELAGDLGYGLWHLLGAVVGASFYVGITRWAAAHAVPVIEVPQRRSAGDLSRTRRRDLVRAVRRREPIPTADHADAHAVVHHLLDNEIAGWFLLGAAAVTLGLLVLPDPAGLGWPLAVGVLLAAPAVAAVGLRLLGSARAAKHLQPTLTVAHGDRPT